MPLRTPRWTLVLVSAALSLGACEGVSVDTGSGGSGSGSDSGPAATSSGSARDATAALDKLKVIPKAGSMAGYSREKFPHWRSAGSNCDVRDSVLKRDGSKVKLSGCNVVAGTWTSLYDGKEIDSPREVDIDHMVPLANAWRTGAAKWTTEERGNFANDLDDPQLVAVSASSNRSKGDQDPSTWKPSAEDSWCSYAQDWIAVKAKWELAVIDKEKSALKDMLGKC